MRQCLRQITCRYIKRCSVYQQVCYSNKFVRNNLAHYCMAPLSMENNEAKKLFTPGPLCVTASVKKAMLVDYGSRDKAFVKVVENIRHTLLDIGGVTNADYTAIPLQGSGTYSIEAVLSTTVPQRDGKVLVLVNGAYGKRIETICKLLGIEHDVLRFDETSLVDVSDVDAQLCKTSYHTVCIVHCETSIGLINPIYDIGKLVKDRSSGKTKYVVDAMSSFGAVPINIADNNIDYLVSSANKCLQGVPGFSFTIARKADLLKCRGQCRSLSLDLVNQYEALEATGQFRFTPPTHSMLAFNQALCEFIDEGGVSGRRKRYKDNAHRLYEGMATLGFETLLAKEQLSHIITAYKYPAHPNFNFTAFYERLSEMGQVIYPGKLTEIDCFRIGTIGDLHVTDVDRLLECIKKVCEDMGITVPLN